jgi:hypothetical protein
VFFYDLIGWPTCPVAAVATVVGAFNFRLNARVRSIHDSPRRKMKLIIAISTKCFSEMSLA